MYRPAGAERCFSSLSPTLRPWIDDLVQQNVVLRGGVLEPDPCSPVGNVHAKAGAYSAVGFPALGCRESFSLRRGLDSIQSCFKLSITFWSTLSGRLPTKKATRLGRPRLACFCGQRSSAGSSQQGLRRSRVGESHRCDAGTAKPARRRPFRQDILGCWL